MNEAIRILEVVLSASVKKHGPNKPLTVGHLHNIVKMVLKHQEEISEIEIEQHKQLINEIDPLGQG